MADDADNPGEDKALPPAAVEKPKKAAAKKRHAPAAAAARDDGPTAKVWTVRGDGQKTDLNFAFPVDRATAKRHFATEYPVLAREWSHPTFTPSEE